MTTLSLELYFHEQKDDQVLPPHPVAQIYVKNSQGHTYPDAQGFTFISSQCFAESD
jgi:hypothetical protein